jgi:hypothetical protein
VLLLILKRIPIVADIQVERHEKKLMHDSQSETTMQLSTLFPSFDVLVLTVPFLAILALAMLGLDARVAAPRQGPGARRAFCGVDPQGRPILSDPDGRPCRHSRVSQIEAKLGDAVESN